MSLGEGLLLLYGAGFGISLLHLTNMKITRSPEDCILRSFLWPWVLLYFMAQFFGFVLFSAFYGFCDLIRYPLNPVQPQEETQQRITKLDA